MLFIIGEDLGTRRRGSAEGTIKQNNSHPPQGLQMAWPIAGQERLRLLGLAKFAQTRRAAPAG